MNQILLLKNLNFDKIFGIEDNENLYEGLNTQMFEMYIFKRIPNSGKNDFDVIDTAENQIKNAGGTKQQKVSIFDILLTIKDKIINNQEDQHHTLYLHTTKLLKPENNENFDESASRN